MALTVGTDTYVSVEDANDYMMTHYASADTVRQTWGRLTTADREVYLRRAAKVIDRQPLRGIPAVDGQAMAFPRALRTMTPWPDPLPYSGPYLPADWVVQLDVPTEVIHAQVEIAATLAMGSTDNGSARRVQLQRDGVTGFSLGDLSEQYDGSGRGRAAQVLSAEARELLAAYLAGSVPIA